MKGNKFKIFQNTKEKKNETLMPGELESILIESMMDQQKFRLIPSEAFDKISHLEDYDYLKEGLYVSRKKLKMTNTSRWAIDGYMETEHIEEGSTFKEMSFLNAKMITNDLKGTMMTPAVYFSVFKYLMKNKIDDKMMENMSIEDGEWLDAIMLKKKEMIVSPLVKNGKITYPGCKSYILNPPVIDTDVSDSFFRSSQINVENGLPDDYVNWGDFQLIPPADDLTCAMRHYVGADYLGYWEMRPTLDLWWKSHESASDTSMRICYKVQDVNKK